ncbi:MAG: hypothetical protein H6832_12825 [Planctomycetes bacterium]|nr:hypothetical protein [Planctomycetota bacterium]
METSVFIRPEVSGLLAKTIEARLHADVPGLPTYERILEVQDKFAGVKTAPVYMILDPSTEQVLGRLDGATTVDAFRTWLEESIAAHAK